MSNNTNNLLNSKLVQLGIILSIILIPIVLIYLKIINIDINDAKTIINLLVQSEAAVIAIVITLSLVAVQLAASSYSTRVIDIFKESPSFWFIMGLYILSITLGLFALITINIGIRHGMQYFISLVYSLGFISFFALIPFILIVFSLLNPSNLIKILVKEINGKNILLAIKNQKDDEKDSSIKKDLIIDIEKDPLQPIIDIIYGSLMRYDYKTLRDGLNAIEHYIKIIFENEDFSDSQKEKILKHILNHLKRIGKLAINNGDEDSIIEILKKIITINGELVAKEKLENAAIDITYAYVDIGIAAVENRLENTASITAISIGEIGKLTIKNGFESATDNVIRFLAVIGKSAAEKGLEDTVIRSQLVLGEISEEAINQVLEDTAIKSIYYSKTIGKVAVRNGLENTTLAITRCFMDLTKITIKNEINDPTVEVIKALGELGELAIELRLKDTTNQIIECLKCITKKAINNKNEFISRFSTGFLGKLIENTIQNKFDEKIFGKIYYLRSLGKKSAEQELDITASIIIEHLEKISEIIIELEKENNSISIQNDVLDIIKTIHSIGEIGIEKNLKETIDAVVSSYVLIGKISLNREFDFVILKLAIFIGEIGIGAESKGSTNAVTFSIDFLEKVGNAISQKETLKWVVNSILGIGSEAIKQKDDFTIANVIMALETILELAEMDMSVAIKIKEPLKKLKESLNKKEVKF